MGLNIRSKQILSSRKKAPRRIRSFKKLNNEIKSPFSNILKKPKKSVNKWIKTVKHLFGGKKTRKIGHKYCIR